MRVCVSCEHVCVFFRIAILKERAFCAAEGCCPADRLGLRDGSGYDSGEDYPDGGGEFGGAVEKK